MVRQWEREQARCKPEMKEASKASTNTRTDGTTSVPTSAQPVTTHPTTAQSTADQPTAVQPPGLLPQVPIHPPGISTFHPIIQPHPISPYSPFPTLVPGIQPYHQVGGGYPGMTPTFAQNVTPYNLPMYPQNPHQLYPMAGPYQPMGDMWFPPFAPHHPIPAGSLPFQPETHYQHLPGPYRGQDPRTYQSQAPTHSLSSNFDHSEHEQRSTGYHEDAGAFPTLQEWFAAVDNHPRRSVHNDQFSQYSYTFELQGLNTLLDLERLQPNQLFERFGISEVSACRLLRFAAEDIWSIRANVNAHQS